MKDLGGPGGDQARPASMNLASSPRWRGAGGCSALAVTGCTISCFLCEIIDDMYGRPDFASSRSTKRMHGAMAPS